MELLDRIREAAFLEFTEKGARFTMDDISRRLGISKKTLYTCVRDKEELFEMFVDDAWSSIKAQETAIAGDPALDPIERLKRVVCIMPSFGASFDYRHVTELEEQYPAIAARIEAHLAADWEVTLGLYDAAVKAGRLREVNRGILREVLLSVMERMLRDDFLERTGGTYEAAMREAVDLVFEGLVARG